MNHAAYKLTQSDLKSIAFGAIRVDGVRKSEEAHRRHIFRQLEQLDLVALYTIESLINYFRESEHWRNI